MPPSSRVCPFCRGLNSADERRCYRCDRPLPGPLATGVIGFFQNLLGEEAVMTRILGGLCIFVFALCIASDRSVPLWITHAFTSQTSVRFGALGGLLGTIEPWRYFSAVFFHFNVLHIAMNGYSLLAVGPAAERQFGRARFVVLFVLCGVLGFVVSDYWYGGMGPPTAGASGALFGAFGSVVGVAYARRDPSWKQLAVQNAVNLAILGLAFPVNNAAHAGGLVTGVLLGFLFTREPRKLGLDRVFGVLAVLLLAASVASIVLSVLSPFARPRRNAEISRQY